MKAIVAVNKLNGIGYKGKLLHYIKEDMKRFKSLTEGGTVIMGRNTFESLPNKKPLPNRNNIVLTHSHMFHCPGVTVCHSVSHLFQILKEIEGDVWVIGGEKIYELLINYCDEVYMTLIYSKEPFDRIFPILELRKWETKERGPINKDKETGLKYRFITLKRKEVERII